MRLRQALTHTDLGVKLSNLSHFKYFLQFPKEEHLLLTVGQRPELEKLRQHRLCQAWLLIHKLHQGLQLVH